mmetsp:Transcript_22270/g.42491  ORF Transcript_22270/g.42491 Transcript_22270/m.42491 type:complete len:706 (-) Transcript_22270:1411-3528(-)
MALPPTLRPSANDADHPCVSSASLLESPAEVSQSRNTSRRSKALRPARTRVTRRLAARPQGCGSAGVRLLQVQPQVLDAQSRERTLHTRQLNAVSVIRHSGPHSRGIMSPGESSRSERKGHKRKHSETGLASSYPCDFIGAQAGARRLVPALRSAILDNDRDHMFRCAHGIAELAKNEDYVDIVVEEGAIEAIVCLLSTVSVEHSVAAEGSNDDVEKEVCLALGLLAIKPEHQRTIADSNALPGLVALLKRRTSPHVQVEGAAVREHGGGVPRRAADAITNLAHENVVIKSRVRAEGGIPPLVALLESMDPKVQRAAAGALRTLAFKNEENKNQIVECGALPMLIFMLRAPEKEIHYEAVGVIGNLVHSSAHIKKKVLEEGALQPVISLLSSKCMESQREAALLLGQFATTDPDYKAKIVQRGAVRPLTLMLNSLDTQLREMAAFALGRLAQNSDNQAGIVQQGGLRPLMELLDSKCQTMQHNAAFALYGLSDNEDNVADIIRDGVVQCLMDGDLILQASKDCVQKTLKRLEEKVTGRVLNHLLYLLRTSQDECLRQRISTALAHLCSEEDRRHVFSDNPHCAALQVSANVARISASIPTGLGFSPKRGSKAQAFCLDVHGWVACNQFGAFGFLVDFQRFACYTTLMYSQRLVSMPHPACLHLPTSLFIGTSLSPKWTGAMSNESSVVQQSMHVCVYFLLSFDNH